MPTTKELPPAANPIADPGAYLVSKGWVALGNPAWESCLYLDPTRPHGTEGTWSEKKVTTVVPDPDDPEGIRTKTVPVMIPDPQGGAVLRPARQKVFTPPAVPQSVGEAMLVQLDRDRLAALEAARALAD